MTFPVKMIINLHTKKTQVGYFNKKFIAYSNLKDNKITLK